MDSDRAGSISFVYCLPPRHGLVPGILGTGKNHIGLEQSHSVDNPWILIRFRKLQLQTSSWNSYFGFSKGAHVPDKEGRGRSGFSRGPRWMAGVWSILNLGTA